ALSLGLTATGTLERLAGAAARGAITPAEAADIEAAYRVILRVRLAHQLAAVAAGRPPDNRVAPRRLDRVERASLTEAFRTVASLQRALDERFLTAQVG
ncbi:MAG TPA: putative nucleotidyltransferase substrate binding domain-containing protein, partial [Thermodesulfobacteriota bacterium]